MPDSVGAVELSETEKKVLGFVSDFWPSSALDVAHHFNERVSSREEKRKASTKYSYYIQKLIEKRLVLGKRIGNAMVVWPVVAEKYRVIHGILRSP